MDMKSVRQAAREKLKGFCRVCPECNGVACAGEMPGMGGAGTGDSFKRNVKALASLGLNLRTLHAAAAPETKWTLFGQSLAFPVLAAPVAGIKMNAGGFMEEQEWADAVVQGAAAAGTVAMTGDGPGPIMFDSGLEAIRRAGGRGIPVTKPRDQEKLFGYLARAEEAGAMAVGIDIDAAGIRPMALAGQPVGPKTPAQLREITAATRLPVILKGIMTADEAEIAAEAGAAAIVVSNHGGRVLDYTPGTAEVLEEIAVRVRGSLAILVDGGVRSGIDVLKMLALGAHAVLVGRPLLVAGAGAGREGIVLALETLAGELRQAMLLTGCATLDDIHRVVLR